MKPVRLFRNFFNLYAYSFWKVCHPLRLFKTIRLLETSEYTLYYEFSTDFDAQSKFSKSFVRKKLARQNHS